MNIVQYTDEEFSVFYYSLKNNFKTTSKVKSIESEEFEYYSKSVNLKIDSCFETIFGQRFNSSLFDYYKQVYCEVKDEDERNSKIFCQVIDNFYYSLNHYYTVDIQSRYFYFLEPLSIDKKLGFQEGDAKFKNFIIKLILQQMRFEDGNFILLDETYGTIINALIAECVKNIRREMIQNTLDLDCNDLINDINKLEIAKNIGQFDFLDTPLTILRILNDDIKGQYEELKRNHSINYSEKRDSNQKITIAFSPFKFRNLLIKFFENAGVRIDSEKKNRINRFILNTVEFDRKKYSRFKGSPSETTINFFDNEKVTICKFWAVLLILMNQKAMSEIGAKPLQEILVKELQEININASGISLNSRNIIRENLNGLTIIDLAKYAGFKNYIEIKSIIKS